MIFWSNWNWKKVYFGSYLGIYLNPSILITYSFILTMINTLEKKQSSSGWTSGWDLDSTTQSRIKMRPFWFHRWNLTSNFFTLYLGGFTLFTERFSFNRWVHICLKTIKYKNSVIVAVKKETSKSLNQVSSASSTTTAVFFFK